MHFHRDADGRLAGAFSVSCLQQVQLATFNREFKILHIAKMLFEPIPSLQQFFETLGHLGNHLRDILGGAYPGDHIFSLCVE